MTLYIIIVCYKITNVRNEIMIGILTHSSLHRFTGSSGFLCLVIHPRVQSFTCTKNVGVGPPPLPRLLYYIVKLESIISNNVSAWYHHQEYVPDRCCNVAFFF